MSLVKVQVKWQSQVFEDIEIDHSGTMELLNAQLFALTNVPTDRQKVMLKGRLLKTNQDLARIADGSRLVLMGTADQVAAAPEKAVVFLEDLTDSQKANLGTAEAPCGLNNLGNTCYLNSAITCFRSIPELKDNLIAYGNGGDTARFSGDGSSTPDQVVVKLGQMMHSLDNSIDAVSPVMFLSAFREAFPQFAQRTSAGGYSQQDADESLTQLLYTLRNVMKKFPNEAAVSNQSGISGLFVGQMESTITCNELPDDQKTASVEVKTHEFSKLSCHISGDTNHLADGLSAALSDSIEKHSPILNRNAIFTKVDRISQLPPYLIVQFVRFFWKKDTQKKAKIMRKVVFPFRLDVLQYCTPQLQKELTSYRDAEDKKFADLEAEKEKQPLEFVHKNDAEQNGQPAPTQTPNPRLYTKSGVYELFALITHKGRAADSGHYIGWARGKNKNEWFQYDDNVVTKQTDDDIQKLVGGGDWHMAYVCFYRAAPWRTK